MSSVIVKNIDASTTADKVSEFFSFCGKVTYVSLSPATDDSKTQVAKVTFQKPAAVSTALLLTDSELDGKKVAIERDPAAEASAESEAAAGAYANTPDDIEQEEKPRSAIIAEYLAHGYILGDKVVARGLEFDNQHGISSRFTQFLKDLDSKYHVSDKAQAADKAYGVSDRAREGHSAFRRYMDDALATKTGSRIRSYYTEIVRNATDVHNEARRLANLHSGTNYGSSTSDAAPTTATSTTVLTDKPAAGAEKN